MAHRALHTRSTRDARTRARPAGRPGNRERRILRRAADEAAHSPVRARRCTCLNATATPPGQIPEVVSSDWRSRARPNGRREHARRRPCVMTLSHTRASCTVRSAQVFPRLGPALTAASIAAAGSDKRGWRYPRGQRARRGGDPRGGRACDRGRGRKRSSRARRVAVRRERPRAGVSVGGKAGRRADRAVGGPSGRRAWIAGHVTQTMLADAQLIVGGLAANSVRHADTGTSRADSAPTAPAPDARADRGRTRRRVPPHS